ncbi:methyltransferase [Streptomyces sp. 205]|uniref:Methyltransferase n=2 Tax=Streptomyces coffeae TaxID=621382 RepID=A0ABS1NQN9_9ACTN|nr:methyltransferase [Streptomyces coffeae]MBL1102269.1 methyltransferase [Streptomyces coffeae]
MRTEDSQGVTATVARLAHGHMAAQVVRVAARLSVADLLRDTTRTSADLARACGADPQAMHRLLRAMAGLGLLSEDEGERFSLTEAGSLLRTDRPDSLHALVRLLTDPTTVGAWTGLEESVRTGGPHFSTAYGQDYFTYLGGAPQLSEEFNAAMSQGTRMVADLVAEHYDFGRFSTVVDIGGGHGTLLAAILRAHPSLKGVVFDSPEGLEGAERNLADLGVGDRCTREPGDFFTAVTEGGDVHVLKSVLHDWNDEQCVTILRHCREALPESGRLLLVERVLPDTATAGADELMYLSDLNMLVKVGGRERTRADWDALLHASGFRLSAVTPLPRPQPFSLIEGTPVVPRPVVPRSDQ